MPVQFEENDFARRSFSDDSTPKFAAWLISKGIAKDVAGANKIQIIAVIVFFALALYIGF